MGLVGLFNVIAHLPMLRRVATEGSQYWGAERKLMSSAQIGVALEEAGEIALGFGLASRTLPSRVTTVAGVATFAAYAAIVEGVPFRQGPAESESQFQAEVNADPGEEAVERADLQPVQAPGLVPQALVSFLPSSWLLS